jgi:hypothetical protein
MGRIRECIHDFSSSEEWKAYEIYLALNKYYSFIKGFTTLSFPKELVNDFYFEILNKDDMAGKNNIITISYNRDNPKLDLHLLNLHLMTLGIYREFIDKGSLENRRFITVWTHK